jgi:hypothetical protein
MVTGIERLHGVFVEWRRTGGALGHGTGPWDDVTGTLKRYVNDTLRRYVNDTSNSIDTLEDEEYDGGRGRRITERILPARCIQSEYWTRSRASRYPEPSDA